MGFKHIGLVSLAAGNARQSNLDLNHAPPPYVLFGLKYIDRVARMTHHAADLRSLVCPLPLIQSYIT